MGCKNLGNRNLGGLEDGIGFGYGFVWIDTLNRSVEAETGAGFCFWFNQVERVGKVRERWGGNGVRAECSFAGMRICRHTSRESSGGEERGVERGGSRSHIQIATFFLFIHF